MTHEGYRSVSNLENLEYSRTKPLLFPLPFTFFATCWPFNHIQHATCLLSDPLIECEPFGSNLISPWNFHRSQQQYWTRLWIRLSGKCASASRCPANSVWVGRLRRDEKREMKLLIGCGSKLLQQFNSCCSKCSGQHVDSSKKMI